MTDFKCKLCNQVVSFDLSHPSTYLSKTESSDSRGSLYHVRVSHHSSSGVNHINVVVVDAKGEYRAHIDFYEENVDQVDRSEFWIALCSQFPSELHDYLSYASSAEKTQIFSIPQPFDTSIQGWRDLFWDLWDNNPTSNLFALLAVKWYSIIGQGANILLKEIQEDSWAYPLYLTLQSSFSSPQKILEKISLLPTENLHPLYFSELLIAKAQILAKLSKYDELENLYFSYRDELKVKKDFIHRVALYTLQVEYGYALYYQGKLKEASELIEEVYNFSVAVNNRDLIRTNAVLYASVLRSKGELDAAYNILFQALDVAKELENERSVVVITINLAMIDNIRGHTEKALAKFKEAFRSSLAEHDFSIKFSLLGNLSRSYYKLQQYSEASKYAKEGLEQSAHLPFQVKLSLYHLLVLISRETKDAEILSWIKKNLPQDKYFDTPNGKIMMFNIQATEAEIDNRWDEMIGLISEQILIMEEEDNLEQIGSAHIRLSEGYLNYYKSSREINHLEMCYNHLDLAKEIILESQNYVELCRITILKGLIALEIDLKNRAESQFLEALRVAQTHKLTAMEKTVSDYLDQLESGELGQKEDKRVRDLFKLLQSRPIPTQSGTKSNLSDVFVIWCYSSSLSYEFLFRTNSTTESHLHYFEGIHDLLNLAFDDFLETGLRNLSSQFGSILLDYSENFFLLLICNKPSYQIRMNLQEILLSLEDFPLRNISAELNNHLKVLLEKRLNIGEIESISLNDAEKVIL